MERNLTSPQSVAGDGNSQPDTGLSALALAAAFHHVPADAAQLAHELGIGELPSTPSHLVRGAKLLGLKGRSIVRCKPSRLGSIPLPAILQLKDGRFVLFGRRYPNGLYRIIDAATRQASAEDPEEFAKLWTGTVIQIAPRIKSEESQKAFGISWFGPAMWRYRGPLTTVLLASLFVQLCGLITPIFFQIIIDKVLVHKGYATLTMVTLGLLVLGLFQAILQYFRTYVLSHTTSRMDVELGTKLFDHLLRLPLGYFETRATGQTVARVREIENVRNFLTGQGLTAVLDFVFTFVFIAFLFVYSATLACIVVVSIPVYILIAVLVRPLLREQVKDRFNKGALSNQFLVELIVGIQTVKSLAVEPNLRTTWEARLAAYVSASFKGVMLANLGQNAIQYVNKVTTALVLMFGAYAVINGDMSVGALVAFNMMMGQVTAPILRLSQLWQDFQQVKVSVDRLGDIMNFPVEAKAMALSHLPPPRGAIQVKDITFRYRNDAPETLKNVSIDIPAGQVVGIVGPSGSGKSTFTKLI